MRRTQGPEDPRGKDGNVACLGHGSGLWVYLPVKPQQTLHLRWIKFILCQCHFTEADSGTNNWARRRRASERVHQLAHGHPYHWPAEDSGQAPRLPASLELKTTKNFFFNQTDYIWRIFLLAGWRFRASGTESKWICGLLFPCSSRVRFCHVFMCKYVLPQGLLGRTVFSSVTPSAFLPGVAFPSGTPQHWVHCFIIALNWSQTSWFWNMALPLISMWPWTSYKPLVLNPFIYKMDKIILPSSLSCWGMT